MKSNSKFVLHIGMNFLSILILLGSIFSWTWPITVFAVFMGLFLCCRLQMEFSVGMMAALYRSYNVPGVHLPLVWDLAYYGVWVSALFLLGFPGVALATLSVCLIDLNDRHMSYKYYANTPTN